MAEIFNFLSFGKKGEIKKEDRRRVEKLQNPKFKI